LIIYVGTPKHISITEITEDIESIEGVLRAHDLHVWTISSGNIALTVHVTIEAKSDAGYQDQILSEIQKMLCSEYNIHHSTVQIESNESLHCNPVSCIKNM
jgi:Co/Zn/Cd efflux system component